MGIDRDDDTMAELARLAARYDPVPPAIQAGARAAFGFRNLDEGLAQLVHDSALDDRVLAGVRGGGARQLTFETDGLTVELEVSPSGRLMGQLVPPGAGVVEVDQPAGSFRVEVDGLGRFVAEGLQPGPVRLRCPASGGRRVTATEWVVL